MAVVAGQSLFAAAAATSGTAAVGQYSTEDAKQRIARAAFIKSILRVYMDAYESMRKREYVVRNGLSMLITKAQDITKRALDNIPMTRTFSYDAAVQLFQSLFREMDDSVLQHAAAVMCTVEGASDSVTESADGDMDAESAVTEFLDKLGSDDVDDVVEESSEEPQAVDTVCDLLRMFTRSAAQDPCFITGYKSYSAVLCDTLLAEMRGLFMQQPNSGDVDGQKAAVIDLPLVMLAMRATPLIDSFCNNQMTLNSVVSLGASSVMFERYLFSIFLQQQPN